MYIKNILETDSNYVVPHKNSGPLSTRNTSGNPFLRRKHSNRVNLFWLFNPEIFVFSEKAFWGVAHENRHCKCIEL